MRSLPQCLVCAAPVNMRLRRSKRTGLPFIVMDCPQSWRHFRLFVHDPYFIAQVLLDAPRG